MTDLLAAARAAARAEGFDPDFGPDVQREVAATRAPQFPTDARDLRGLLWSSIDNVESQDLDQIEYAERVDGGIRLMIGIADVDALVPRDSAIDLHAKTNATSLYTGVAIFPMLPEQLSAGLTSLLPDQDRLAIVIDIVVRPDGSVDSRSAYRAIVRNKAKLAYESVGAWLEKNFPSPDYPPPSADTPIPDIPANLAAQLQIQAQAARELKNERRRAGALEFDTIEARPITKDGRVVDLTVTRKNRARDLIEDFMIAANISTSKILESKGSSGIRRVVRRPERWPRIVDLVRQHGGTLPPEPDSHALAQFLSQARAKDPLRFPDLSLAIVKLLGRGEYALDLPGKDTDGHFGLAADDYSHATAPNRRYADLVQHRLLKTALAGAKQPYTNDELAAIAAHCTDREDAAQKVERHMRKVAAADLLSQRVGQSFDAIVTGVTSKGTFARLL
ncbi:MAG TPA: ribonuclease catalytic domain-containing protein, partial [Gemmatimonadaceae bacterium]|nr:ribonuclease catalytic domain-containing protein [Gemmatimonadaceae bacterium]